MSQIDCEIVGQCEVFYPNPSPTSETTDYLEFGVYHFLACFVQSSNICRFSLDIALPGLLWRIIYRGLMWGKKCTQWSMLVPLKLNLLSLQHAFIFYIPLSLCILSVNSLVLSSNSLVLPTRIKFYISKTFFSIFFRISNLSFFTSGFISITFVIQFFTFNNVMSSFFSLNILKFLSGKLMQLN